MIVSELYDGQGLGNQLWNYVVARIIAKHHGVDFYIEHSERFKGKDFMPLDFGSKSDKDPKDYYKERTEYLCGTDIDISRTDPTLLSFSDDMKFNGNCQSTKYLDGYRQDILSWLSIKDQYKKHTTDEHTCVIHIRFGDFAGQDEVFLPISYYRNAMEYIRKQDPRVRFYCVTDEKDKAKKFLPEVEIIGASQEGSMDPHKAGHHKGGPIGIDFTILMQATYLIIPNSSFSWWSAYLNTHKKIVVAPKYWARYNISDGYWSTSDIITDGFTYIDREGRIYSAKECWQEKEHYQASHPDIFCDTKTVATPSLWQRISKKLWKSKKL